jgi:hypothetical protein
VPDEKKREEASSLREEIYLIVSPAGMLGKMGE